MIFCKHFFSYCNNLFKKFNCFLHLFVCSICFCELVLRRQSMRMIFREIFLSSQKTLWKSHDCFVNSFINSKTSFNNHTQIEFVIVIQRCVVLKKSKNMRKVFFSHNSIAIIIWRKNFYVSCAIIFSCIVFVMSCSINHTFVVK